MAVHLLPCEDEWDECRFEIVRGRQADLEKLYAPSQGTIRRGNAVSPWSGDPVPGDYIKQVSQTEGMGSLLFALCVNRGSGRDFRLPTDEDVAAIGRAAVALAARWDDWIAGGLIPVEPINPGNKTDEPRRLRHGPVVQAVCRRDSSSQMLTYLEGLRELSPEMELELGKERAAAVRTYSGVRFGKVWRTYNCNIACFVGCFSRDKVSAAYSIGMISQ